MTRSLRKRAHPEGRPLPGHFGWGGKPKVGYQTRHEAWAVEGTTGVYLCDFPGCGMFHRTTHEPRRVVESRA